MQHLEVSCAVRPIYKSLGFKGFIPLLIKAFAITVTSHLSSQSENKLSAGNRTHIYRLPQRLESGKR